MSLQVVPPSPMTLGEMVLAASASIGFLTPLSAQIDLVLFGPFGIGSIQADLSAQFHTALALNADLAISIVNPIASFQQTLAAVLQQVATLEAALALGVPTLSVDINTQIAANAALAGSLAARLGGVSALIEAALQVKLGALQFISELQANLAAGPIDALVFGFDVPMTAADVGAEATTVFQTLPGIQPTDQVYGVMLITKNLAASQAIEAMFKTS